MLSLFDTTTTTTATSATTDSTTETTGTTETAELTKDNVVSKKSLFDVFINHSTGTMELWKTKVGKFDYNATLPFSSLFVPTVESVRLSLLLKLLVETPRDLDARRNLNANNGVSHSVLCVGTSGVGKSVIMRRYLNTALTYIQIECFDPFSKQSLRLTNREFYEKWTKDIYIYLRANRKQTHESNKQAECVQ